MDIKEKIAIIHNLMRVKKFTQAIINCHKLIKLNPNVSYLYNLCGMAYQGNNQIKKSIESFSEGIDWLMAESKRGYNIQRYKGLGEMNPDQLWETTLDPDARTLLQVRIDDVAEADDLFTKLMGDVVEPRRDFIQNNALNVSNLDF